EPQRGSVTPTLVEGRLPQSSDEVALGTETLHRMAAGIGDTVPIHGGGGDFRMRVVGRIVMPNFFFSFNRPGQGAALTLGGADRVAPEAGSGRGIFARYKPGIDDSALARRLKQQLPGLCILPR